MSKIGKILTPLKEYNKPLLELKGNAKWMIERLQKEQESKTNIREAFNDQLHMPGLSRKAVKVIKANFAEESRNVRNLNELVRHQKALAYEEQLARKEAFEKTYKNAENSNSAKLSKSFSEFFQNLYA